MEKRDERKGRAGEREEKKSLLDYLIEVGNEALVIQRRPHGAYLIAILGENYRLCHVLAELVDIPFSEHVYGAR